MNRRRFLGAAGVTTATALTGCLGVLEGGSGGSYDTVTKYTYADDQSDSDGWHFSASQWSPATELELDEYVSVDLQAQLAEQTTYTWGDVDPGSVDHVVQIDPGGLGTPYYRLYLGSFDLDAARDRLGDRSEGTSTYEGFDVYTGVKGATSSAQQPPVAAAVGEGAIVQSGGHRGHGGSVDQLHRVVDAAVGSTDPITGEHDGLAEVATRIRPGLSSYLEPWDPDMETDVEGGIFAGMTATGDYYTVDGDTVNRLGITVFESSDAASEAPMDEWASLLTSIGELESATHSVDGRVVEVEGSIGAAAWLDL